MQTAQSNKPFKSTDHLKNVINGAIRTRIRQNKDRNDTARQQVLGQIKADLSTGKTKQEVQHLINRYIKMKPQPLNQMQQALAKAAA